MARDDFTRKTIDSVAKRVAYRCCFKGCGMATIGPKYGDSSKTSNVGIGCHIYAASPNGPRYDPNMTAEERKSADNCVWMCSNHARIIDADEKAYPAELLRRWKDEAEREAADRLKEYEYRQEELSDKKTLESIFDALIKEGQYVTLILLIKNHKKYNSQDELLLRYEIYYNCYCNIGAIPLCMGQYLKAATDEQCGHVAKVLVSLNIKEGLKELLPRCADAELKKWAEAVLGDSVRSTLLCPEDKKDEYKDYMINDGKTAAKLLSSFIVDSEIPFLPKKSDGEEFALYEGEFLFKVRASAWRVFCEVVNARYYVKDMHISADYIFLKGCADKLSRLDKRWQAFIRLSCLNYCVRDREEFDALYGQCPAYIKEDKRFSTVYKYYCIYHKLRAPEEYLGGDGELADEQELIMVLRSADGKTRAGYLDEHRYLLGKNSLFLFLRLKGSDLPDGEKYRILLGYRDIYSNDVMWNAMAANYADGGEGRGYLQFLKDRKDEMDYDAIGSYISALQKYGEWEELGSLFFDLQDNGLRYITVVALCGNDSEENYERCIGFLKQLEKDGFCEKGFYRTVAVILYRLGHIAEAKKYYEKEYAIDPGNSILLELLQIKYYCNERAIDGYVEKAAAVCDADLQYITAAFYAANNDTEAEKKYLIRSLLIDPQKTEALHRLASVYLGHADKDKFGFGKIFELENGEETKRVALLRADLTDGAACGEIVGCEPVSDGDYKYLSWKLSEVGDDIEYLGRSYKVKNISSFSKKLYDEALASFLKSGSVTLIAGESPADAIREITKIVEDRKKGQDELFEIFNKSRGILPVSILARQLGTKYYTAWGHIISGNKMKLNNGGRGCGEYFILSTDAICTLAAIGALKDIDDGRLVMAKQSKSDILSMFSSILNELQNDAFVGTLQSENGQIYRMDYDKNYRKGAVNFYGNLMDRIGKIRDIESSPYKSKSSGMNDFFIQEHLSSERYLLGLAKSNENYAVVSDEPFICSICEYEKIPHISAIDLLFGQDLGHEDILKYLKILDGYNFLNYFSPAVYIKMLDSADGTDDGERREFLGRLGKWLVPEKYSEDRGQMIFDAWRELYAEDPDSVYARSLSDIGRYYFSRLYPEEYKELIQKLKNTKIETDPPDGDTEQ